MTWGNPDTKTFQRQNLRWATYDTTKVQVHRLIWPMIDRILISLDQAGVPVGGAEETTDPLRLGFRLAIPAESVEMVSNMVAPASFVYRDGEILFTGTPEDAVRLCEALGAGVDDVAPDEDIAEPDAPTEPVPAPFAREASAGDEGREVLFLQYLTGADPTGVWDEGTTSALRSWQARNALTVVTGELDEETWRIIIPRRVVWLRPGATGLQIKVIQAAFKAHGYMGTPVTGVWGVELSHSLRLFQQDHRIHPRLRIGAPEWETLFGPRP